MNRPTRLRRPILASVLASLGSGTSTGGARARSSSRRVGLVLEKLEDRLALSATPWSASPWSAAAPSAVAPPVVEAGPDVTVHEGQQPNVIPMKGTFTDPTITPYTYVTAIFYLRRAGETAVFEDGGVSVEATNHTLIYDPAVLPPGDYVISLEVTVANRTGRDEVTLHVVPNSDPPAAVPPVVDAGPDVTVHEGQQPNYFPLQGTFVDPNATAQSYLPAIFYVRQASNNAVVEDGGVMVDVAHHTLNYAAVQLKPGDYVVTLQMTDGPFTGSDTMALHVLPNTPPPTAPKVVAPANGDIGEGDTFSSTYSFSDPDGGPWTVRVNFGDGSPELVMNNVQQPQSFNLGTVYAKDSANQPGGVFHGHIQVTDATGLTGAADFNVRVHPAPLSVDAGADVTVTEGAQPNTIPMTASFHDRDRSESFTSYFVVRRQDGTFVEDGGAILDPGTQSVRYSAAQLPAGQYTVTVVVSDGDSTALGTTHLDVLPNHAPVVVAPANVVIPEGGTFSGTYGFSDPDGGPWTVRVSLGNGSPDLVLNNVQQPASFNFAAAYARESADQSGGVYHGGITVTDATGLSAFAPFTVTVQEVTPKIAAPATLVVTGGTNYTTLVLGFADAGAPGNYSGSFAVRNHFGRVVGGGPAYVDSASHQLRLNLRRLPAGRYTLSVTLVDDGASVNSTSALRLLPRRHTQNVVSSRHAGR